MPFKLSRKAEDDIRSILTYGIEEFGEAQALNYREGLERMFQLIADTPKMGRQHRGEIRRFPVGSHIIFYEIADDHILILRVRHSSVDPETYL